ncbi:MAG: 23S rRNA (adenine(2503)-C(2))-methyltransferase RlmN [Planctomycetota bacterium]|nr:23S rRNA (adenine(2503)-C(2))-methyltransferase RlmN [Planctomycetota bacterium]
MTGLAAQTLDDLTALFAEWGEKRFRAAQVFTAVQQKAIVDPLAITTLPMALRERLLEHFGPPATKVVEVEKSDDGTTKYLFELHDGKRVESVLIPEDGRNTVCVSSQVGCPIRCVFCASGVKGLIRNLDTAEIVEQLLRVTRDLGQRPSNVVMMGMGEPLLNFGPVTDAIRLWIDEKGLHFSPRRITVSTAGTVAKIKQLGETNLRVQLAISLHAATDETRAALVPGSPDGRVQQLVDAAAWYTRRTGRESTLEYVLIQGENDRLVHADALVDAIDGRPIHVNLIPLNPVRHRPDLKPPSGMASVAFADRLRGQGVSCTLRTQRGEDINAACGQLALERSLAEAP